MTSPPPSPLPRFALRVLLVMPVVILVWWYGMRWPLLEALGRLVEPGARWLMSGYIVDMVSQGGMWQFRTTFAPLGKPLDVVAIGLPPSRFTVAFPLLWGLVLATPGARRLWQLGVGTLVLIPAVVAMLLVFLQFRIGLYVNHQAIVALQPPEFYVDALPFPQWAYYLMAVGRQLAVLVLPTLIPLLLWGTFNRTFIRRLIATAGIGAAKPASGRKGAS